MDCRLSRSAAFCAPQMTSAVPSKPLITLLFLLFGLLAGTLSSTAQIISVSVNPEFLSPRGGSVEITVVGRNLANLPFYNITGTTIGNGAGSVYDAGRNPDGSITYKTTDYGVPENTTQNVRTYTVRVSANLRGGGSSEATATFTVKADTTPPALKAKIAPESLGTAGGKAIITLTAEDIGADDLGIGLMTKGTATVQRPDDSTFDMTLEPTRLGSKTYIGSFHTGPNLTQTPRVFKLKSVTIADRVGNRATLSDQGTVTVNPDVTPPRLNAFVRPPTHFGARGGTFTLVADAGDDGQENVGLDDSSARATIQKPDGSTVELTLNLEQSNANGTRYIGTYETGSNATPNTLVFAVTSASVKDKVGNIKTVNDVGMVTVAPDNDPPKVKVTVNQGIVGSEGGMIIIQADVTDRGPNNTGAGNSATAVVHQADSLHGVALLYTGINPNGSKRFQGSYSAPANAGGVHQILPIVVTVADLAGNTATDETMLLVLAGGTVTTTVSGTITLPQVVDAEQSIAFEFRAAGGFTFTLEPTLLPDGSFSLPDIPRDTYAIGIKGDRWLRRTVGMDASTGEVSLVTATLPSGDANNDNMVNIADIMIVIEGYNSTLDDAVYNEAADFNCDGSVNTLDLLLLISNFNLIGDP